MTVRKPIMWLLQTWAISVTLWLANCGLATISLASLVLLLLHLDFPVKEVYAESIR